MPIRRGNANTEPSGETHHLRAKLAAWLHLSKHLNPKHYGLTAEIKDLRGRDLSIPVEDIESVEVTEGTDRARIRLKGGVIIVASLAAATAAFAGIKMYVKHHK